MDLLCFGLKTGFSKRQNLYFYKEKDKRPFKINGKQKKKKQFQWVEFQNGEETK